MSLPSPVFPCFVPSIYILILNTHKIDISYDSASFYCNLAYQDTNSQYRNDVSHSYAVREIMIELDLDL